MAFFDNFWYVKDNGTIGWSAVTPWAALGVITAGTWRRQLATPTVGNERCFVAIVAGTTGAAEPTWVVTRGGLTTDGTVTWQECTGMAATNEATQTNAPTWATVKNLAVTLGEVIYDSASSSLQICSTAGTAGNGSTPAFSATAGVTTVDNTITWTSLGNKSAYTGWQYPHSRINNAIATNWLAAGGTIYVSNNHAETQASALTWAAGAGTAAAQTNIICVSDTASPPTATATTASVATTGANSISINTVQAYVYGLQFLAGNAANAANITLPNTIGSVPTNCMFDTCVFKLNNTNATSNFLNTTNSLVETLTIKNCSFLFGATTQAFSGGGYLSFNMLGGSIASTGAIPASVFLGTGYSARVFNVTMNDVDLSNITGTIFDGSPQFGIIGGSMSINNCKLGAAVVIANFSGNINNAYTPYVKSLNCDSSGTNYRYYFTNGIGTVLSETTRVRTGGASDGTTGMSWNITSSALSSPNQPFISEPIPQWNDNSGVSKTATVYLTSNTALTNKDCWLELEYPSSASSPLGGLVTTKMALLGTPVALTTDASTWGGAALTYKYSIALPFTPQMKGVVKARIYLAKPSTTVYIDPLITIA